MEDEVRIPKRQLNALLFVYAFDKHWAYFVQSGGRVQDYEMKRSAREVVKFWNEMKAESVSEASKWEDLQSVAGETVTMSDVLGKLDRWIREGGGNPFDSEEGRYQLWLAIMRLEMRLSPPDILHPPYKLRREAFRFREQALRWSPHVREQLLSEDVDDLMYTDASKAQTICLVGDIRASQELMTYAKSADDFSERVSGFFVTCRNIILAHGGIIDKFTGDGFIAYFSEPVSAKLGYENVDQFLLCVGALMRYGKVTFEVWGDHVRKLPAKPIGIAIGADIGTVEFKHRFGHLVAVSDAIVWASRMASAAAAGEVLINNLLRATIEKVAGVKLEAYPHETKSGEGFIGFKLASNFSEPPFSSPVAGIKRGVNGEDEPALA